jgi:hypothetical protein
MQRVASTRSIKTLSGNGDGAQASSTTRRNGGMNAFLACTHLSVEDLHEVKCNRILRDVDIQLQKADSQKTGTASLLCVIVASAMTCGSYHPEITLHRPLDDVAAELRR